MDKRIIYKKVYCPRCQKYLGDGTIGLKVKIKCPDCNENIFIDICKDGVKIERESYGKKKF